jgi:pimeloyl-ACP methyl ester carboxylesterase
MKMKIPPLAVLLLLCVAMVPSIAGAQVQQREPVCAKATAADGPIPCSDRWRPVGSGTFEFLDPVTDRTLPVHYFVPRSHGTELNVLFVIHGLGHTASKRRTKWRAAAKKHGVAVFAPDFHAAHMPRFSKGSLRRGYLDSDVRRSSFAMLERLFDHVRSEFHLDRERYDVYGHSAGGQFVSRMVVVLPHGRYRRAVAANPGSYLFPNTDHVYPYGLRGSPIDGEQLDSAFGRRYVLLIGTKDNDPEGKDVPRAKGARAQGPHRLARARNYMRAAVALAKVRGVRLRWRAHSIADVGHSSNGMRPAGIEALYTK